MKLVSGFLRWSKSANVAIFWLKCQTREMRISKSVRRFSSGNSNCYQVLLPLNKLHRGGVYQLIFKLRDCFTWFYFKILSRVLHTFCLIHSVLVNIVYSRWLSLCNRMFWCKTTMKTTTIKSVFGPWNTTRSFFRFFSAGFSITIC